MWFNGHGPPPPGHPLHGMPHPAYPPGHPLHIPVMAMGPPGGPHPPIPHPQLNGNAPRDDKAKKQRKPSKATPHKRLEDMNVGNGINPVNITPAQLQNLQSLGINPTQFAMMNLQLQQNGVLQPQATSANPNPASVSVAQQVASVQAPMIAHPPVPQPQPHHLAQQQAQQQLQAQAQQQAQQTQQQQAQQQTVQQVAAPVPQPNPQQAQPQAANAQAAQLLQQFQALQAAQAAQQAAQQQMQLAQQMQQAQMVNAVANPPCPPPPPGIPSMPWPISTPVCHIPYFDMTMYRHVNIEATPSHDASGMDLPLTDITTLRFFFNLGVQQSRNLIAARQQQAQQQAQQQSQQQQQQQHPNLNDNLAAAAAAAAQGGNANLLALVNSSGGGQVPNQNTIEQLNALLGQHNILRQAQQLQGPQGQQVPIQQQLLQQQLNQILAAQRTQQQQQQMQQQMQQQASQNAMQQQLQQINALVAQQVEQQRHQQQNVQNAQIAAAATAAAAGTVPSVPDRKVPHTELVNATGQAVSGLAAPVAFQVTSSIQQPATTPIPPAATPNSQQQHIQKHFDGQTLLLQQALLQHAHSTASTNNKATLHDIRFQAMAQQQQHVVSSAAGPSNLHPYVRPTEAVRQAAAASGGGGEPNISPRPIPVDPSPPRATSGGASAGAAAADPQKDGQMNAEDDKPSSSAPKHPLNPIGIANPLSATAVGFPNQQKLATVTSGNGNPGLSGATPVHSIIQMSEDHFTDTFRKSEQKRQQGQVGNPNNGQAGGSPKTNGSGEPEERPPALAPILMMSYLNNCMSHAKTHLTANGVHVGVDDNGQLIDYSSRPIDPIFKDAREDMKSKDVRNLEHAVKRSYQNTVTTQVQVAASKKSPSPQTNRLGQSPQAPSPLRQPPTQNPLGINRSIPDAAPPKIEIEHDRSPGEDSEDDGAKRLRIATDEE